MLRPLDHFARAALVVLALLIGAGAAAAQSAKLTFLLTNDVYQMSEENGRGGLARLAAIVKAEKAKGGTVLFAHAGDTFSPCLLCGFDRGAHMVALFNEIPPDVFVPGNHEFDFGPETYARRRAEARFPFFAANLRAADGSLLPGHQDRTILDVSGVKVGIVGLALETTPSLSSSGDLVFAPALETLRAQARELRTEGADLVVAVAHTDRATDFAIQEQRLVDVLLTGHDHDLRIIYDGRTAMAESGQDGHYVVALELDIAVETEAGRRRARWHPNFRIIDTASVPPDPEVARKVAGFEAELARELDVPLGKTAVELDTRNATVRSSEAAFGNLVADAVRAAMDADLAIVNAGGFRGNRLYPPGAALTRRDIVLEMPFGNDTALVELTGSDIRAALENGFSVNDRPSGRFPHVSGLTVEVDRSRPPGSRVVSVRVGDAPLDDGRRYRVATNNFMLRGGDGYTAFGRGQVLVGGTDGKPIAGEVMAHIRKLGTITARPEGRILMR